MANLYYDIRVDIQKDIVIDSGLRFTQGDSKVIYLRIAVMNGATKFDASNTTPSVNFVKPDGTYVVGTPVESGDFWVYQILGNELQSAGKVLCDVKFTYASGRVSSSKFTFVVEKDTTISDAAASSSYVLPMEQYLAEMKNYRDQGYSMADTATTAAGTATTEADRAKSEADRASSIVGIGIATTTTAGIVKPDGTTITVDSDGTIHSQGGSSSDTMLKSIYDTDDDGKVDSAENADNATTATNALNLEKSDGTTISADTISTNLLKMENTDNKVTTLSSTSTDTEYPSAKCVYDLIGDVAYALSLL